jgi:hypothetical protein
MIDTNPTTEIPIMRTLPMLLAAVFLSAPVFAAPAALADVGATKALEADPITMPTEADRLFAQADELEASATSNDITATSMEKTADALTARVRSLRTLASQIPDPGRSELLAKAAGVEGEANSDRSRAKQLRRQAADFRSSAQELRGIAQELNNQGGGHGILGGPPTR